MSTGHCHSVMKIVREVSTGRHGFKYTMKGQGRSLKGWILNCRIGDTTASVTRIDGASNGEETTHAKAPGTCSIWINVKKVVRTGR